MGTDQWPDELEIPVKAKSDGEYVEKIRLGFDYKFSFSTFRSVAKAEVFIKGGTGEREK